MADGIVLLVLAGIPALIGLVVGRWWALLLAVGAVGLALMTLSLTSDPGPHEERWPAWGAFLVALIPPSVFVSMVAATVGVALHKGASAAWRKRTEPRWHRDAP